MKREISVTVPNPCKQNWNEFTQTASGGFCAKCQKTVIDFTSMSDQEILAYFSEKKEGTCGRFSPNQLKTYVPDNPAHRRNVNGWLHAAFLTFIFMVGSREGHGQTPEVYQEVVQEPRHVEIIPAIHPDGHIIKGMVVDEFNKPFIGVNVIVKGTAIGTITDEDGRFELSDLSKGNILMFSFLGYETIEYKISENAPDLLKIPLITMSNYCTVVLGAAMIDDGNTQKLSLFKRCWLTMKRLF